MSERKKARNSPLRDLMIELHNQGITVKFYDGRPGQENADVFFVQMPAGVSLAETCELLARIDRAMEQSVALSPSPKKLTYASALSYTQQINEMKGDAACQTIEKRKS